MMLSEINAYLAANKRVCMADLVNRFSAPPEALRGMIAMLLAKKRIIRLETQNDCSGCTKCDPDRLEIYEWCGS